MKHVLIWIKKNLEAQGIFFGKYHLENEAFKKFSPLIWGQKE